MGKKEREILQMQSSDFKSEPLLSPILNISQIPPILNYIGNINKGPNTKVLCVIGSRKATQYGKDAVDYLLSGLVGNDIIIVSGLAVGIDSAAHNAAIKYGLRTIAFPGAGLNYEVLYPSTNIKLADKIVESGGALISEFENDARSQVYFFPARNRIMAAVSDLILVVESEEKSGTQITARLALEYNKELAIVPGSIFSSYSRGTARLYKDGAHPVTSSDDILYILGIKKEETDPEQGKLWDENNDVNLDMNNNLSNNEKIILRLLKAPLDKDFLIEESGLIAFEALSAITSLEANGYIKDNFGEIKRIR
jgi:DNA processing protein